MHVQKLEKSLWLFCSLSVTSSGCVGMEFRDQLASFSARTLNILNVSVLKFINLLLFMVSAFGIMLIKFFPSPENKKTSIWWYFKERFYSFHIYYSKTIENNRNQFRLGSRVFSLDYLIALLMKPSWEISMQVRKQQLELDMKQQTGSK